MAKSGVSGLVLTGGQSSRMGVDKALIVVDGVPLGLRVVEVVGRVANPVLVVGPHRDLGVEAVVDGGHGPLAAFAAGWKQLRTQGCEGPVVLAACDMPLLSSELLQMMVDALGDHEAAVPLVDGRRQPLAGCYAPAAYRILFETLARGESSMKVLLDSLDVREVDAGSWRSTLIDVDTPADLEAVRRPAAR